MTKDCGEDVITELWEWFEKHVRRQYGEIGFVVTKHEGQICKVEKIDRERISNN